MESIQCLHAQHLYAIMRICHKHICRVSAAKMIAVLTVLGFFLAGAKLAKAKNMNVQGCFQREQAEKQKLQDWFAAVALLKVCKCTEI